MLSLLVALLVTQPPSAPPLLIEVHVPLCDAAVIECGLGAAGDPESLSGNLYWGARYGAERYLSRAKGFTVLTKRDRPHPKRPHVLREVTLVRAPGQGEREVRLTLVAHSGLHMDDALDDYLQAVAGGSPADIVAWAGHDHLMDVPAPKLARAKDPRLAVVLACSSEQYFGPVLRALGAPPLALTRTFMAPEAYLLEALAAAVAAHGPRAPQEVRLALVEAYARFQRISPKAAGTVFSRLSPELTASPRAP